MELRSRKLTTEPAAAAAPPPSQSPATSLSPRPATEEKPGPRARYPLWRVIAAWLVHLYTATGLLVNMYSLLHALFGAADFSLFAKLNWLAILIDATDGTLARLADVKRVAPGYDGAMLDNIIDFQTFAVLPALAVIVFELVPGKVAQFALASVVLLASAYQFCQTVAKTTESFVGFPSYWNIVVFYVYYLRASAPATVAVFALCAALSFVPIHFIYPTRTLAYYNLNIAGAYVWGTLMLVPTFFPESPYVATALYVSFIYVVYYVVVSVMLDLRRRREE